MYDSITTYNSGTILSHYVRLCITTFDGKQGKATKSDSVLSGELRVAYV